MFLSPELILMAVRPAISAEVPEFTATACFVPTNLEKDSSNALVSFPSEILSDLRTLSTASLMGLSTLNSPTLTMPDIGALGR